MKPRTVFTVTRKIQTETGSALLTVTVYETDEALIISHLMNGELSYVFSATKKSMDVRAVYPNKRKEKCTVSRTKEP